MRQQASSRFLAVDARKVEIEKNDIRRFLSFHPLQCLLTGGKADDLDTDSAQHLFEYIPVGRHIIDDEGASAVSTGQSGDSTPAALIPKSERLGGRQLELE